MSVCLSVIRISLTQQHRVGCCGSSWLLADANKEEEEEEEGGAPALRHLRPYLWATRGRWHMSTG
jgi:hypothetical protein